MQVFLWSGEVNDLDTYQKQQLTGQAECYIHTHPRFKLDQVSASELEDASRVKAVTATTYTVLSSDEQLSFAQNCTITLPPAAKGKEYHITLTASGKTLTINPTSPDTIMGDTSMQINQQWTSLHLKAAEDSNWILI